MTERNVFAASPVDPSISTPLYMQVLEELSQKIRSGKIPQHTRFPNVKTLKDIYGTSKATIELALDKLVTAGLITRKAGRGTFVIFKGG